jgi:Ca2+-binding EF-hand superfamily protein
VTLLSIPESSFSVAFKMFDIDNNGLVVMHPFAH